MDGIFSNNGWYFVFDTGNFIDKKKKEKFAGEDMIVSCQCLYGDSP